MTEAHCEHHELVGSYLLAAIPDDERARFEDHLASCAWCRADVAELRMVVDLLPAAVDPVNPPQALRDRIMTTVESEASLLRAAGESADRVPRRQPKRFGGFFALQPLGAAIAVAFVLVAGVLGYAVRGGGGTSHPTAASTTASRVVSATVTAPGARAEVVVHGNTATLIVHNLPAPPAGRIYEVWLQHGINAAPTPTDVLFGVSHKGEGNANVPGGVKGVVQVLVTAEPLGGSPAPTQTPLISARVS
jgi:anti-sigma factor RsiW